MYSARVWRISRQVLSRCPFRRQPPLRKEKAENAKSKASGENGNLSRSACRAAISGPHHRAAKTAALHARVFGAKLSLLLRLVSEQSPTHLQRSSLPSAAHSTLLCAGVAQRRPRGLRMVRRYVNCFCSCLVHKFIFSSRMVLGRNLRNAQFPRKDVFRHLVARSRTIGKKVNSHLPFCSGTNSTNAFNISF